MKTILKNAIPFSIIFLLLLILGILQIPTYDFTWGYGFSYNISQGLIPYKDFNMIIGPSYSLLFSIPMIIFGNSLIAFKIFHVLIYSIIMTLCYQKIGKKVLILLLLLFSQITAFGYNVFMATLIILIMLILDSNIKQKNLIIGLIIGYIAMTKHNIGLTLIIVYLFTAKKKLQSILYLLIPISITILYLLLTNSFFGYINFCYLGMGNFIDNLYIDNLSIITTILLVIYLIIKYIQTKNRKILHLLAFLIILFPLIETTHLLIVLIPTTYYILENETNKPLNRLALLFIMTLSATYVLASYMSQPIKLETKNKFLKYNVIPYTTNSYLKKCSKYIQKIDGNVYLFIYDAYRIKLYNNQTTTFMI